MEEGSLRCDANVSLRPRGRHGVRHQDRDQEPELVPQRRARPGVRGRCARPACSRAASGSSRRRSCGTRTRRRAPCARRSRRTTTATSPSPTSCPSASSPPGGETPGRAAELPRARRRASPRSTACPPTMPGAHATGRSRTTTRRRYGSSNAKIVSNWVMSELLREISGDDDNRYRSRAGGARSPRRAPQASWRKAPSAARSLRASWRRCFSPARMPHHRPAAKGSPRWLTREVGPLVDRIVADNPQAVDDWKRGKSAAAKALVGQVMKATAARPTPPLVNRLVEEKLSRD